jgi:hypothetical protein
MTVTRSSTITTEEGGRTNMWATEPRMYISSPLVLFLEKPLNFHD